MELFFELLRHASTLIFGVYLSAAFLSIRMTKRNIAVLSIFSICELGLQAVLFSIYHTAKIAMMYPLLVHLPLLLLFVRLYRRGLFPTVIAITTAYLCCCISNWISLAAETVGAVPYLVNIIYTLALAGTASLILLYISVPFASILKKSTHELVSFGILPIFYYAFDYSATVYTEWLYTHNLIAVEFPPLLLCICYLIFCTVYFREYEEKREMENRSRLVEMKHSQSEKELIMMKRSEETISLLRHDMRHFLNNISGYISCGETEKAQEYIHEIIAQADSTAKKRYCANEIVNMILSSYEHILTEKEIDFRYSLKIPKEIQVSDVDMTSILSNGMENAIHAVCMPGCRERIIELKMTESGGKLFISLENTYGIKPEIIDGIPVSRRKNHGLGTQSIQYTTEKTKGNCHFSLAGDRFVLRIVL